MSTEKRGKFQTDGATADDREVLRQGRNVLNASGIKNMRIVGAWDIGDDRRGARVDHNRWRIQHKSVTTCSYCDFVASCKRSFAINDGDAFILCHRKILSIQLADQLITRHNRIREILARRSLKQQLLRGDATYIDAGTAIHLWTLLNQCDLIPRCRAFHRDSLACFAETNNNEIKFSTQFSA